MEAAAISAWDSEAGPDRDLLVVSAWGIEAGPRKTNSFEVQEVLTPTTPLASALLLALQELPVLQRRMLLLMLLQFLPMLPPLMLLLQLVVEALKLSSLLRNSHQLLGRRALRGAAKAR